MEILMSINKAFLWQRVLQSKRSLYFLVDSLNFEQTDMMIVVVVSPLSSLFTVIIFL